MTSRRATCLTAVVFVALATSVRSTGAQTMPPPSASPPAPPAPPTLPAPDLTPSPAASPPGSAPPPGASPSARPSGPPGVPIRLDRARVGVVPGTTSVVHVAGGTGALSVNASFEGIAVRYDDAARTLFIQGRANGRGTVTIADTAGDTAAIDVLVAPPAGVVPADAAVTLAGNVGPAFAAARIRAAIASTALLQPGSTVTVSGVSPQALRPGDVLEARAAVRVNGNGTYVDQTGTTAVHLRVGTLPPLEPVVLFYSDDPERLGTLDDGVLFRGTIDANRPARAYVYHVSDAPGRHLYLALSAGATASDVQVLGALAGPSDAFSYVGHLSTQRYLLERAAQESFVATVSPGAAYLVPLPDATMLPGQLTAAIYDLRVLSGDPVSVAVVAASNGVDPASLLPQPEHPGDGHARRGEYALTAVPPLALAYTVGTMEPPPFAVGIRYYLDGPQKGRPVFPNLRPGGAPLAGDYGVLRAVQLQLTNPTPNQQTIYLYGQPGNGGLGGVTTTIWFAGYDAPTEVRCVSDPGRYLVKPFALAPGESRTVSGSYMTDGTSWFPLSFGLTATAPPPAPQNGCGAKTPGVVGAARA